MLEFFLIFLTWLVLIYFAGYIASFFYRKHFTPTFFELIFRNIFTGYIVIVLFQSIISTAFETINFVFIIIILFTFIELKKQNSPTAIRKFSIHYKSILILFIAASLLFIYGCLMLSNPDEIIKFSGNGDTFYYSKIAKYIALTGQENESNVLNTMDKFYNGPQPYHYFDLWGAAFISNFYKVPHYISLNLIIYPTFYFMYLVGLLALINKNKMKVLFMSFILLLIGGLPFNFSCGSNFLNNLDNISYNILNPINLKLSFFYVFILASYILYHHNHFSLAILCILSLTIANIVALPTVVIALLIIVLIKYKTNKDERTILLRSLIYIVTVVSAIGIFYSVFKRNSTGLAGAGISSPISMVHNNVSFLNLALQRNIILAGILGLAVIYFPFTFTLLLDRKYFIKKLLLKDPAIQFVLIVITSSLVLWSALYMELNSRQVHQNISIPILNVALSVYFINAFYHGNFYSRNRFYVKIIFLVCIFTFVFQNMLSTSSYIFNKNFKSYDDQYLKKVRERLIPGGVIASLNWFDQNDHSIRPFDFGYTLGEYLFYMNEDVKLVNIGDCNTTLDSTSALNLYRSTLAIKDGIFYRFCKSYSNKRISNDELMLIFLKKYNIRQILISTNATLPDTIFHYVKEIIIDKKSHDQFVLLN
jgi:hypothetical protein